MGKVPRVMVRCIKGKFVVTEHGKQVSPLLATRTEATAWAYANIIKKAPAK